MGLYKTTPLQSGRMGTLWCLSGIRESAVVEYGCMGHMVYGRTFLHRLGSQGSRLYSTHISETDITMGDTGRLKRAVAQVSEMDDIRVIFLLASSTPEVAGVDLEAAALELSAVFPNIPLIPMGTGGFDRTGSKGVEETLLRLAKRLPKSARRTDHLSFNLIGSCADIYRFGPDAAELARIVEGAFHADLLCCMTSDTSISALEQMGSAHFNLVLRREGVSAAEHLEKMFGTPWLYARPYGIQGTLDWVEQAEERLNLIADRDFLTHEKRCAMEQTKPLLTALSRYLHTHTMDAHLVLCGHGDVVAAIAEYGKQELGFEQIECYCDDPGMATPEMSYLTDELKEMLSRREDGFLMASGELLQMAGRDRMLQISLPDDRWHHRYEPPFMGFRGAVHLLTMLANDMQQH